MKYFKLISFVLFSISFLTFYGCKEDETPPVTPPEELIIGTWKSVSSTDDGIPVNTVDGYVDSYKEMVFREDSTVTINDYDVDGEELDSTEDNWLMENDNKIVFSTEPDVDLISITADLMSVEYDVFDTFSETLKTRRDNYSKK